MCVNITKTESKFDCIHLGMKKIWIGGCKRKDFKHFKQHIANVFHTHKLTRSAVNSKFNH
jgi:hypothetical protein